MKKLILISLVVVMLLAAGCDAELETMSDVPGAGITDYRDPETGVHYLIYGIGNQGGMCVRYNADGSIMVD